MEKLLRIVFFSSKFFLQQYTDGNHVFDDSQINFWRKFKQIF